MSIIGIDLGTTNSLVSYWDGEKSVIIPNSFGENLTPSIVSVDEDGQVYVGKIAKERQITHPNMTASVFKRNMGTKKNYRLGIRNFLPEELSSFIVRSLKQDAEAYLGQPVEEAIISVPAYFNDAQRKATKRAGELAGIRVERLINEPTAAAIAYGLHQEALNTKFLIFDLGGGTFDVSILELYKNVMEVRAVAGDNYLGGEDFTAIIMDMFLRYHNLNLQELDLKSATLLRKESEIAKKSFSENSSVIMKCTIRGEVLEYKLKIGDYERACESLITRIKNPIKRALNDASIMVNEIDSIVLVGGATKLPIIRSFVSRLFGRLPNMSVNPDEVVALGAGLQGAIKARSEALKEVVLTDVCPYTLGTSVSVKRQGDYYEPGYFCPIIERNTIIPVSRTEKLYTIVDNQKQIQVDILQGEGRLAKENMLLGELNINIPPAPAGDQCIDVRYTYDINGILEVEVTTISTGNKKRIVIEENPGYMSKEEIEKRLEGLSHLKIHPRDKDENKLIIARGERLYEESTGDVRIEIGHILQWFEGILDSQDEKRIKEAVEKIKDFFDSIDSIWEF